MCVTHFKRRLWLAALPISLLSVHALASDATPTHASKPIPLNGRFKTPEQPATAVPAKTEAAAPKTSGNGTIRPKVDAHPVDVFELPDIDVIGNTPDNKLQGVGPTPKAMLQKS